MEFVLPQTRTALSLTHLVADSAIGYSSPPFPTTDPGPFMDYHLKPMGKTCAATDALLEPGTLVHSVLVERDGETIRLDYSTQGWDGPPEGTIGHWRSLVPEPEAERPKPLDPDGLLEQFERMTEDANPAQEKLCYVIALLLMQKRRLQLEGTRRDGDIAYLQFIGQRGEGPFEVREQQLTGEEIASVQSSLNQHLHAA